MTLVPHESTNIQGILSTTLPLSPPRGIQSGYVTELAICLASLDVREDKSEVGNQRPTDRHLAILPTMNPPLF